VTTPRQPWDESLIGGREKRDIVVVPYDASWPQRFVVERDRISAALGPSAHGIYHIGSTAVAGLAAKPIIDITMVVAEPDHEATYLPALERAGYELRVRGPRHRMLRTPERDVHIHVWGEPADTRRHLLFRDWLSQSAADRATYQALKLDLAQREWDDGNAYADAKSELIEEIMGRAETWAQQTGWHIPS
jgi:GrpB-like predicted nucleotidyltransferase (UPF0157 family)